MNPKDKQSPDLQPLRQRALLLGGVGLAASLVTALIDAPSFFQGYLYAFLFWVNLSLGCLGLLMLHHLVGGSWGFSIQRLLEAGARLMPFLAVAFLPLVFGLDDLYAWARPAEVEHDTILQHKAPYLNVQFFLVRTAGYLILWSVLAYLLSNWSRQMDRPGSEHRAQNLEALSGPGIVLFVLSVTFASTDWAMSLEAHWFSTIYGLLFVIGQALAALTFCTMIVRIVRRSGPLHDVVGAQQAHDLGNLTLAFVMLWTYVSLSQFLIIWAANLPEEVPWYLRRIHGAWGTLAVVLFLFHFVVPFMTLLARDAKRDLDTLWKVSLGLFGMRALELLWLIVPAYPHSGVMTFLACAVTLFGLGGLWVYLFIGQVQSRPLLAEHDPRLEEAFEHHG